MYEAEIERNLRAIMESLADIEHQRWAHWQRYVHAKGIRQADGSMLIPADLIAQWDRQLATPYERLSEKEKESDRKQVLRYLPAILKALAVR